MSKTADKSADIFAAVDLGSNSFHMAIARLVHNELRILDQLRDRVQLARGLSADNLLGEKAQDRALKALDVFGERVGHLPHAQIRAVGTNTLRRARNGRSFLKRARQALGHPIEVISGQEEARLVYLGVAHTTPSVSGRRLVVDIGGGSTEVIIGDHFEPTMAASLYMGCVSFTRRFFPDGKLTEPAMAEAETAARQELETMRRRFRELGWQSAKGSSGTVRAIQEILRVNGWSPDGITLEGLHALRAAVLGKKRIEKLSLPGLSSGRTPVLPGGLAILTTVFEELGVQQMQSAPGALREGVLYDLLGRVRHEDIRDRTIQRFIDHYQVDLEQAARVERTALRILEMVGADWDIDDPELERALSWAARLHEIGLALAYRGYHRHGAYLVSGSDMPGFSTDDQILLSGLIRCQRRKLPTPIFDPKPFIGLKRALRLSVCLRLGVLLNRGRSPKLDATLVAEANGRKLSLRFAEGWLDERALMRADLETEVGDLAKVGIELTFS